MGVCTSKPKPSSQLNSHSANEVNQNPDTLENSGNNKNIDHDVKAGKKTPTRPPASGAGTPRRFFKRPPSPAKHIKAVLARRHGSVKQAIPEGKEAAGLDKSFGFSKKFYDKYEVGEEVGRGHFGYACRANFKKGELKGQEVAVKIIPKAKVLKNDFLRFISLDFPCLYIYRLTVEIGVS